MIIGTDKYINGPNSIPRKKQPLGVVRLTSLIMVVMLGFYNEPKKYL